MDLSIVICTHNRASELEKTLSSLKGCGGREADQVEILVVSNASTDGTEDVCDRAGVQCVAESRLGLSHARNKGIEVAKGDAILWLDDDVTLQAGLVETYLAALLAFPDHAFFGGPIEPVFEGAPPHWVEPAMASIPTVWSHLDYGGADRTLSPERNEYPFGANMLIRRRALGDGFRTDLGRSSSTLVGGEETALLRSLAERGERGRWVAAAKVWHRIGRDRQNLAYIARYFEGYGIESEILSDGEPRGFDWTSLAGHSKIGRRWLRYLRKRMTADPAQWLRIYADLNIARGRRIAQRRKQALNASNRGARS
ncbi:MAG: glycosyltransferase family 2 protein [Rubricella sp.]